MTQSGSDVAALLAGWTRGRGRKAERLAVALERALISGNLTGPLPAERRLAATLGISRGTVTAAYGELKERRLLASRPGGYTRPDLEQLRAPVRAARLAARGMAEGTILGNYVERNPNALDLSFAFLRGFPGRAGHRRSRLREGARRAAVDAVPRRRLAGAPGPHRRLVFGNPQAQDVTGAGRRHAGRLPGHRARNAPVASARRPRRCRGTDVPAPWTSLAHGAAIRPVVSFDDPHVLAHLERNSGEIGMVYAQSVWRNPTGALIDRRTAVQLARLSASSTFPLLDDRALEYCGFDSATPPPIALYAPDAPILTLGSLDKTTGAGTRIGWIRAPQALAPKVARLKALSDLASPGYLQRVAMCLFDDLETIGHTRRAELARRYDHLAALLHDRFPAWTWQRPHGGASVWVDVKGDADALVRLAARTGVTMIAGSAFTPDSESGTHVRIALGHPPSAVDEATRRPADAIEYRAGRTAAESGSVHAKARYAR